MGDKIKIKEAADLMDVSDQTIYGMIRSNRIHSFQPTGPRGRIYVSRSEILDFLKQSGQAPETTNANGKLTYDSIVDEIEKIRSERPENTSDNRWVTRIEPHFSPEDYAVVEQMAERDGISKPEFVRRAVLRDIRLTNLLNEYFRLNNFGTLRDDH